MGEDEYDALPDEEKQRIDQKRLQRKKDRILKYEYSYRIFDLIPFVFFSENKKLKKKKLD
jgi:hypothetical protein